MAANGNQGPTDSIPGSYGRSLWKFFGAPDRLLPESWLLGPIFALSYLGCNFLTQWHEFGGFGITIWSPDSGLTLLFRLSDLLIQLRLVTLLLQWIRLVRWVLLHLWDLFLLHLWGRLDP